MKIPFRFLPASWGLVGKSYEKAKAEYELSGLELKLKLTEIEHGENSTQVSLVKIEHDLANKTISQYEHDCKVAEILKSSEKELKLNLLEIQYKHHKITKLEYDKQLATAKDEPWVSVIKISVDPADNSKLGELELDWNDKFVEDLKSQGYTGVNDYMIIDSWFTMVCAAVANEQGIQNNIDLSETFKKMERDLDNAE